MQYNIFQNNFYDERPGVPWAYRLTVFIGDPPMNIVRLTKAVKEVTLPDIQLNTYPVHFGGMVFQIPTRYKNSGEFNIKFYENKNLQVYKSILDIFHRTYDNRDETFQYKGEAEEYKYSDFTRELQIMVEIMDPAKINQKDTNLVTMYNAHDEEVINGLTSFDPEVVAKYIFTDCYFENIEDIDLAYDSEDCVEWSVNVKFNGMSKDYKNKKSVVVKDEDVTNDSSVITVPGSHANDNAYVPTKKIEKKQPQADDVPKFDAVAAYRDAHKTLEEEKAKAKQERESAVALATAVANDEGMTPEGDFVTAAQRESAIDETREEVATQLNEKYNVNEFAELGVDLTADKKTVTQQADSLVERAVEEGGQSGYDLPQWDATQQIVQKSEDLKIEAAKADKEIDIAWRNTGAVEMNDTESTNKYYANRQTQEQKTALLNERAAKIQSAESIINDYEVERQFWKKKQIEEAKMYRNGTGSYAKGTKERKSKIFNENYDSYTAKIQEIDKRIEAESETLKSLRSE